MVRHSNLPKLHLNLSDKNVEIDFVHNYPHLLRNVVCHNNWGEY